jgi:hypothetical protein
MQVLWNSSCLDSLLFSMHNESPSAVVNDPAWMVAVRSLYQKIVREWIVKSLSYAPCTSQGLLQVCKYTCCWSLVVVIMNTETVWYFEIYPMEVFFSFGVRLGL